MRRWAYSLALALLACGDGGQAPADPIALSEWSDAAMQAACDWAVRCRHVPDRELCFKLLDERSYDTRRADDAIRDGRLAYDAFAGGECVRANREGSCQIPPLVHEPCRRLFRPLVEPGGSCTSNFECEGQCEITNCDAQCCFGTCGAAPSAPSMPAIRLPVGARCQTHNECIADAYCESQDGRCRALPTEVGQRCLFGCAPGDLYCDVSSLSCRAYAERGASCDPSGESAEPCDPAWAYCLGGVCVDRPGPGESCEDPAALCAPPGLCVEGVCAARGEPGSPCGESRACEGACDELAGVCVDYEACRL